MNDRKTPFKVPETSSPDAFHKRTQRQALGLGPFGLFWLQIKNTVRHSIAGGRYLFKAELAAKVELCIFGLGVLVYLLCRVPLTAYFISIGLFLLLLATEALNTAVEVIIDYISPHRTPTGKHAKDLGAFAVVCVILINLAYFCWVVYFTVST